jgi:hypothetical protein
MSIDERAIQANKNARERASHHLSELRKALQLMEDTVNSPDLNQSNQSAFMTEVLLGFIKNPKGLLSLTKQALIGVKATVNERKKGLN